MTNPPHQYHHHSLLTVLTESLMTPPASQIPKSRPQGKKLSSPQTFSGRPRRSSRLRSKLLGTDHEPQTLFEQRQIQTETSQLVEALSPANPPTHDPDEALVPVLSKGQFQEHSRRPPPSLHQTRKRTFDESVEPSIKRPHKRARLTEKNLKAIERMGGPTKKSAGKRSGGTSSLTATTTDTETKSTRSKQTVSSTEPGFGDRAFENGILNPVNSKPPSNLTQSIDRINRTRTTASPSESEYEKFAYKIRTAPNEQTVLLQTSQLLKEYGTDDSSYSKVYNNPFNAFPKDVELSKGLSAAQPDMIEGFDLLEFDPFPVRHQLGGAAVPSSGTNAITLSHFAGEWKGPGKDMILAQTQAAYDGACMVYGRNKARSFLKKPDPAGRAYVSTFTTDGTTLNTFAHYSSKSQGQTQYHQYPTSSTLLISSYDGFKSSRRRLRNQQDDAKEASARLRDELKEKWLASQQHICEDDEDDVDDDEDQEDEEDGPSSQLLTEYYTSFTKDTEEDVEDDESLVQIPTPAASSATSSKRPLTRSSAARPATKSRRSHKTKRASRPSKTPPETR